MTGIAIVLCSAVAALGAIGVVSPEALLSIARRFQTPSGLYAAAAFRLVVGGVLLLAAPASRAPRVVRVVGVLVLVAGLLTPVLGVDRLRGVVDWWAGRGPIVMRVWAAGALAFGGVLIYLLAPGVRRAPTA